jgi:predicted RecB family nuclease
MPRSTAPTEQAPTLTKSAFVTGYQCQKLLWWKNHEPDAAELKPDKVLLDRFDQGRHVTSLARDRFPGATLIPPGTQQNRIEGTRFALDFDTPVILEAAFAADGVFIAADILRKQGDGYKLTEVKSATRAKDEHIPDLAVQVHVARKNGVNVTQAEIMHLNGEFRHPDVGDLFSVTDKTAEVEAFLPQVPRLIQDFQRALSGSLPEMDIGLHCDEPWACPFQDRCWPDDPWHISMLYQNGPKKTDAYLKTGVRSIRDLPPDKKLPEIARRQIKSLESGRMIVEPTLRAALRAALGDVRLGYLDFETINRAVPVWDGLGPWRAAVVQFSYHEQLEARDQGSGAGDYRHVAYLAEGPHDPQAELAERMLEATAGVERIVMYSPYERTQINQLAERVPAFASDLKALAARLVDLAPLVREHVYHPGFNGSFSIKDVLNPLVPDLTYQDLVIVDGQVASVEIARLLFVVHLVEEREQLRRDLLAYCERDTWAMVRLVHRLKELAG